MTTDAAAAALLSETHDDTRTAARDGAGEVSGAHARRRAADRPAAARQDRRRRLVPFLLTFVIGVIATTLMWQSVDGPDDARHMAAVDTASETHLTERGSGVASNVDSAPSGILSIDSGDGELVETERAASRVDTMALALNDEVAHSAGSAGAATSARRVDHLTDADHRSTSISGARRGVADASRERAPSGPALAIASPPRHRASSDGFSTVGGGRDFTERVDIASDAVRESNNAPVSERPDAADWESPATIAVDTRMSAGTDADTMSRLDDRIGMTRATERDAMALSSGEGIVHSAPPPAVVPQGATAKRSVAAKSSIADAGRDAAHERIDSAEGDRADAAHSLEYRPIQIAEPAPRRGWALAAGARQSALVALDGRAVHPELVVSIGGEIDEGAHAVFAVLGLTTFNELSTVTTSEYRPVPASPGQEYLHQTRVTASDELRAELFGGAGYRVRVVNADEWQAGAGVWAGYGERYVRAGAELPDAYRLSETVRIELTPSVQYLDAHGESATQVRDESVPQPTGRSQISERTEVEDTDVRAGFTIGVTVVIE